MEMRREVFDNTSRDKASQLPVSEIRAPQPQEKKIEGPRFTPEQDMAIRILSGLIRKTDAELLKTKGKVEQEKLLSHFNEQYKELIEGYKLWGENLDIVSEELKNIYGDKEHLDSSEAKRISAYDYLKTKYFPLEVKNKN